MSSRNVMIAVVVLVVVLAGGWFLLRPQQTVAPAPSAEVTPKETYPEASVEPATNSAMMEKTKVTISATGFSPKTVTIKVGEAVTWTNSDSANHTVNSDPHPTHTIYPSLNLGPIQPGTSKSLTFDKVGTYRYHDHLNPSLTGTVTVQ